MAYLCGLIKKMNPQDSVLHFYPNFEHVYRQKNFSAYKKKSRATQKKYGRPRLSPWVARWATQDFSFCAALLLVVIKFLNWSNVFNPCCAGFFRDDTEICFTWFREIEMSQDSWWLPRKTIWLLLMTWWWKEPWHQQLWYWPCLSGISYIS